MSKCKVCNKETNSLVYFENPETNKKGAAGKKRSAFFMFLPHY